MDDRAPQSFRRFLIDRLVSKVPLANFTVCAATPRMEPRKANVTANCLRLILLTLPCWVSARMAIWLSLIRLSAISTIPQPVKVVELDEVCRAQQVNDGAFATIDDVPRHALSLTIPTIMARPRLFAIVPGPAKREAIKNTIEGPMSTRVRPQFCSVIPTRICLLIVIRRRC